MAVIENNSFEYLIDLFKSSNIYYLVLIDNEVNYAYLNNYFLEKYAALYKEGEKKSALAALHPDDYELAAEISNNCRNEPDKSFEVVLRKLNGKGGHTITQWEFKANITTSGEIEGIIGVGYDITDFETRSQHINILSSAINDVAYKQSHVIRRPLANIIGLIEVLENSTVPALIKTIVKMLRESCNELSDEFNDFTINDDQTITPTDQEKR